MKYNSIIFLAALSLAALSTGCSSNIDDTAQVQSKETIKLTLTEQSTSVSPMSNFVVNDEVNGTVPTRSSFTGTFPSTSTNGVTFKWESGDNISLNAGGTFIVPNATSITPGQPTASFTFLSVPNYSSYTIYYNGTSGTNHNGVNIAAAQTQTSPNDSKHIGADGDCGIATIQVSGSGTYGFTLSHKSSYLCFLPYNTGTSETNGETKLTKVTVETTDGSKIAGAYTLNADGTLTGGSGTSITLTLSAAGFPIYNYLSQSSNAAYMVIAPGTHALKITYDILLPGGSTDKVIQTVASTAFNANTVYSIQKNVKNHMYYYSYHLWDAIANVWDNGNTIFPTSSTNPGPSYWYNTTTTANATHLDALDPTAFQTYWYVMSGDAHWDATTMWSVDGRTGQGGMWLLKSQYITNFNNTPPTKDLTLTSTKAVNGPNPILGKPASNVLSRYFFLPAAGYYGTYSTTTPTPIPIPTNLPIAFSTEGHYHIGTVRSDSPFMFHLYFSSSNIQIQPHSNYQRSNAAMLSWVVQ